MNKYNQKSTAVKKKDTNQVRNLICHKITFAVNTFKNIKIQSMQMLNDSANSTNLDLLLTNAASAHRLSFQLLQLLSWKHPLHELKSCLIFH